MKIYFYISLTVLIYGCSSLKQEVNSLTWPKNYLEFKLVFNDNLGLIILQPKEWDGELTGYKIVNSIIFLCNRIKHGCNHSFVILKELSWYGKLSPESCAINMQINDKCQLLIHAWLAIYKADTKNLITYPYDPVKKKLYHLMKEKEGYYVKELKSK